MKDLRPEARRIALSKKQNHRPKPTPSNQSKLMSKKSIQLVIKEYGDCEFKEA